MTSTTSNDPMKGNPDDPVSKTESAIAPVVTQENTDSKASDGSLSSGDSSSSNGIDKTDSTPMQAVPFVPPIGLDGLPLTDEQIDDKIRTQVEFYFSDSNLPRDAFLKSLYDADPDNWIELITIASFKRMQTLTNSVSRIVSAISSSPQLKLSADKTRVTRATPLPGHINASKQIVYAEGFPLHASLDSITAFFHSLPSPTPHVLCVRMRKDDRKFNGTAFVELSSQQEAEAISKRKLIYKETINNGRTAIEGIDVPSITRNGDASSTSSAASVVTVADTSTNESGSEPVPVQSVSVSSTSVHEYPLTMMTKNQFFQKLKQEGTGESAESSNRSSSSSSHAGKKRKKDESEESKASVTESKDAADGADGDGEEKGGEGEGEEEEEDEVEGEGEGGDDEGEVESAVESHTLVPDLLVKFDTVNPAQSTRESLKAFISPYATAAYADYSKGEETAVVRLTTDSQTLATALVTRLVQEGKLLDGISPSIRALTGEEEKAYWESTWKRMDDKKRERAAEKRGRGGRRGGGIGRGGRGGGGRGSRGRGRGGRSRGRGGRGGKRGGRGGGGKRHKTE